MFYLSNSILNSVTAQCQSVRELPTLSSILKRGYPDRSLTWFPFVSLCKFRISRYVGSQPPPPICLH